MICTHINYSFPSSLRRPARPRPSSALVAAATIATVESAVPVFGNSLETLRESFEIPFNFATSALAAALTATVGVTASIAAIPSV